MNTTQLIAALTLSVAATGAFASAGAGEAVYEYPQAAVSQNQRAHVQAAQGPAVHVTEATGQAWTTAQAPRSREAVRSEAVAAVASGEILARASEAGGFDARFGPSQVPVFLAGR
jgi:hypothetical protein